MVRVNNTLFVHLIPVLQLAIAPVILISGVGLLLLTRTNRFGRVRDRARALNRDAEPSAHVREQIEILRRRASILRTSVMLGAIAVLLAPVLILVIFVSALFGLEAGWLVVATFSVSQIALIGSLIAFIPDMNLFLTALTFELNR